MQSARGGVGGGRVWESLLPLTWVQTALGGNVAAARSAAAARLLTVYRAAAILALFAVAAYQIAEDCIHRVNVDFFYIWFYVRLAFSFFCVLFNNGNYRDNLMEFSQLLERVDIKLKLTTRDIYRSLFKRHAVFVFIVLFILLSKFAYPLYKGNLKPINLIWIIADLQSLSAYILVSNIEARLKVLSFQVRRRLHRDTNGNLQLTTRASWIGWIFLSERKLSTCCSGPMLSTDELIEAYDGILVCTRKLHGILFGQMLLCIVLEFGNVIAAVHLLSMTLNQHWPLDICVPATHALLLWLPCVSGENICSQIRTLRLELARILALEELTDDERRLNKDLLFMVEVTPVRFTVCRMLPLDLSLATGMTNQLTTFIILMVQTLKLFKNNSY